MASRLSPLFAGLGVVLISGLVHGIWTQRWQTSHALEEACARVGRVPANAGSWKGTAVEVDPEPFQETRAVAWWMRRYDKEGVSGPITVILMCGRPDHMSVHTPDICYRGAGFEIAGQQVTETIALGKGEGGAELWTARFRQPSRTISQQLRMYWTWSADGSWRAPTSPRWAFGSQPFLYKLYVAQEFTGAGDNDAVTTEFLGQLLPVLTKSLFQGETPRP